MSTLWETNLLSLVTPCDGRIIFTTNKRKVLQCFSVRYVAAWTGGGHSSVPRRRQRHRHNRQADESRGARVREKGESSAWGGHAEVLAAAMAAAWPPRVRIANKFYTSQTWIYQSQINFTPHKHGYTIVITLVTHHFSCNQTSMQHMIWRNTTHWYLITNTIVP